MNSFYLSLAWRSLRLVALNRDNFLCQPCLRKGVIKRATMVHHKNPIDKFPELALALDNLESECDSCHNREHPEKGKKNKKKVKKKNLNGVRVIKM